jgi:hypothetical protein
MAEAVRIVGHKSGSVDNEQLQAQVKSNGSLQVVNEGFVGSDIDETGDPAYYGLIDSDGNWKIISMTEAGAIRYCRGSGSYSLAWVNRAGQTYEYYFNLT